MKWLRIIGVVLFFSCFFYVFGNQSVTFKILDVQTAEPLIGAAVINQSNDAYGKATDLDGQAVFDLARGQYNFTISYLGYKTDTVYIKVDKDTLITYHLQEGLNQLSVTEVVGKYEKRDNGVVGISQELFEKVPTYFGEREVVKALQLLPGVQSGSEGSTSIFVRGGGSDQNLVLYDGVPLFNLSHLFGVFSVFNSDVIGSADLYKNYMPAAMTGRVSSAISVLSKPLSYDQLHFGFQIGLLNTKAYFESPLIKDKLAVNIAMRGSYAGIFIKPISKSQFSFEDEKGSLGYYFYDINAGLGYKINEKNKLKLNFMFTDDRYVTITNKIEQIVNPSTSQLQEMHTDEINRISWKNDLVSLSHQWQIRKNLFFNQQIYWTSYNLNKDKSHNETFVNGKQSSKDKLKNVTDISTVSEYAYQGGINLIREKHVLKAGTILAWRPFLPDRAVFHKVTNQVTSAPLTVNGDKKMAQDYSIFADYAFKTKPVDLSIGARLNFYQYDAYQKTSFLPRISLEFNLPKDVIIQLASQANNQNMHMMTGSAGDIVNDFWIPAASEAPVEMSYQQALSVRQNLNDWSWSMDVYYRSMTNQIEFDPHYSYNKDRNWKEDVISGGLGRAYGIDWYLSKKVKNLHISVAYSLSKSERKFNALNRGDWYPYKFDRRHDVSFLMTYEVNPKLDLTVTWVYGSGRKFQMPDLLYPQLSMVDYYDHKTENSPIVSSLEGQFRYFESRNNKAFPAYHHLDIGMNYKWKKGRWNQSINVSVYNVYNRKNVFDLVYRQVGSGENEHTRYDTLTLMPIMPSLSYAIQF